MTIDIAPIRNLTTEQKPWEGNLTKKPWEYEVCAAIPVLDTIDELELVIELLQLQTIKPYIIVIDTGSSEENLSKLQGLRKENVEIHSLRLHGVIHPSDFPAMAMDLAVAICRSPYLLCTHADCFLTRQNAIEDLLKITKVKKIAGYRITPRQHKDWSTMVGHTWTMLCMDTLLKIGASWSLWRLAKLFQIENHRPNPMTPNWPDTELLINYIFKENGFEPYLIGTEENFQRNITFDFDHCRTLTSGMLYSPEYYKKAKSWADDAKRQAKERIASWSINKNK